MLDKIFELLLKILDRVAVILGTVALVNRSREVEELKEQLEIRDEVKAIKDINDKLSRDELIRLLSNDEAK